MLDTSTLGKRSNSLSYFTGLYPKLPLPARCFSHYGAIFYMTIYAKESLRLVAIDINTSQVSNGNTF